MDLTSAQRCHPDANSWQPRFLTYGPYNPLSTMYNRTRQRPFARSMMRLLLLTTLTSVLLPVPAALAESTAILGMGWIEQIQGYLVASLNWIESLGAIAPLAFILLYIIVTIAFVPASVVTLGAGIVFGVIQGSLLVFVGAMVGATVSFLIGRYGARDWVAQKIAGSRKFSAIDDAIGKKGGKIVFLLRLSPVFPFNVLNYGLGLTQVSLKDYVMGTLGILPGTVMYVYLGSLLGSLAMIGAADTAPDPQTLALQWTLRGVGLLATVGVTVYITRVAQTALREAVPETQEIGPADS